MIVVEVKAYGRQRGMEMVHYLEIINDATGDSQVGNYSATLFAAAGLNRRKISTRRIAGHPRHLGALELVRRTLNELHEAEQRSKSRQEERRLLALAEEDPA